MLQRLVTDHPRLKEGRRNLIRSGEYTKEAARALSRECKSRVLLPAEAVKLVAEVAYLCPKCRETRVQMMARLLDADKVPAPQQCDNCRGFSIRVYQRLDVPSALCYQPVILKEGAPIHQIFIRSKEPRISIFHFAVPAIDYFLLHGQWPAKQGIALPQ